MEFSSFKWDAWIWKLLKPWNFEIQFQNGHVVHLFEVQIKKYICQFGQVKILIYRVAICHSCPRGRICQSCPRQPFPHSGPDKCILPVSDNFTVRYPTDTFFFTKTRCKSILEWQLMTMGVVQTRVSYLPSSSSPSNTNCPSFLTPSSFLKEIKINIKMTTYDYECRSDLCIVPVLIIFNVQYNLS